MSNISIKQENPWQDNPWDVSNIQEFLFYNCPECDIRLKDGKRFVQHALDNHELSKFYLKKPIEEILQPNNVEILHQKPELGPLAPEKKCQPVQHAMDNHKMEDIKETKHAQEDQELYKSQMNLKAVKLEPKEVQDHAQYHSDIANPIECEKITKNLKRKRKQVIQTKKEINSVSKEPIIQEKKFAQEELYESQSNFMAVKLEPDVILEVRKRKQILQTREELDSESQKPNIQEKKLVQDELYKSQKNLMVVKVEKVDEIEKDVQEYHSDSDPEFEPVNKKQRGIQNVRTKVQKPIKAHICKACNKSFNFASRLKQHLINTACGRAPETQLDY